MASNPLMDALKMLKNTSTDDLKNASTDSITGMLGNILEYTEKLQDDIAENAPADKKEKYLNGVNSLNEIISKTIADPTADVDTSGVSEIMNEAKGITSKKHKSKLEKEAAKIIDKYDEAVVDADKE